MTGLGTPETGPYFIGKTNKKPVIIEHEAMRFSLNEL